MDLFDAAFPRSFAGTPIGCVDGARCMVLPLIQCATFEGLDPPISNNLLNSRSLVRVRVGHPVHETLHWHFELREGFV